MTASIWLPESMGRHHGDGDAFISGQTARREERLLVRGAVVVGVAALAVLVGAVVLGLLAPAVVVAVVTVGLDVAEGSRGGRHGGRGRGGRGGRDGDRDSREGGGGSGSADEGQSSDEELHVDGGGRCDDNN